MKRFADSLVRQKGIKPPPGYKTSISICRKFLSEHAPKKSDGETAGKLDPKPVSAAQLLYAKKLAQGKGLIIPDDAKTNTAAMSAWIDTNRSKKRRKLNRKASNRPVGSVVPQAASPKMSRKQKVDTNVASMAPAPANSIRTPLRIPYGNKDVALGARYGSGGCLPRQALIFLHSANGDGCKDWQLAMYRSQFACRSTRPKLVRRIQGNITH